MPWSGWALDVVVARVLLAAGARQHKMLRTQGWMSRVVDGVGASKRRGTAAGDEEMVREGRTDVEDEEGDAEGFEVVREELAGHVARGFRSVVSVHAAAESEGEGAAFAREVRDLASVRDRLSFHSAMKRSVIFSDCVEGRRTALER